MQTARQIRQLLADAGLSPRRRFGQNFLIDGNLMARLLDLADPLDGVTVLEVGPGTGSLTEELLARGLAVVAVEIDHGLAELLRRRLGERAGFTLIEADALASKHRINPQVTAALGGQAQLIANLPYNVATPLVMESLLAAWHARRGDGGCTMRRLTFSVQQEVAERMAAAPGSDAYGPVSVLVRLLGRVQLGAAVPATAFWPRPKVASRFVRIDFDGPRADALADVEVLRRLLGEVFTQRRKQIGSTPSRRGAPFAPEAFAAALAAAGVDRRLRGEAVAPETYRVMANALARRGS